LPLAILLRQSARFLLLSHIDSEQWNNNRYALAPFVVGFYFGAFCHVAVGTACHALQANRRTHLSL
jgi:hypothetical protein